MLDYEVSIDRERECFIIKGSFDKDAIPAGIPSDNPDRKQFIDLFLHKADIERGLDFLKCISVDKAIIVNEGLFIAGLNNCMKCFKYSKSRSKLDKAIVFEHNEELFNCFTEFEIMRDKHFDHDESGMLQATAFLLVCPTEEKIFGGPPSVVWNRVMFDYYVAGQKLQEVMQHTWQYLYREIDRVGCLIETAYNSWPKEQLLALKTPKIELASDSSKRN